MTDEHVGLRYAQELKHPLRCVFLVDVVDNLVDVGVMLNHGDVDLSFVFRHYFGLLLVDQERHVFSSENGNLLVLGAGDDEQHLSGLDLVAAVAEVVLEEVKVHLRSRRLIQVFNNNLLQGFLAIV